MKNAQPIEDLDPATLVAEVSAPNPAGALPVASSDPILREVATDGTVPQGGRVPLARRQQRGSWAVLQGIVSGAVIVLLNAGTGVLTARLLLPAGRGDLAAMTIWPLLIAYLTSLGMPSAVIYFLRNRKQETKELISTALTVSFVLGCVATLGGVGLLPFWLRHYSPEIIRAAQFFLLAVPVCAMNQTGRAVLEASGLYLISNFVQISQPAVTLILLLLLVATHHLTPITGAFVYTVSTVPTLLIVLSEVRRVASGWRVHWASARLLASYGVRSFGIDVLGVLALQVDQVLVISLLTPAAMGTYGVALSLSRMFNLFQGSVVTVLFPRAAGRSTEEIVDMTEFATRVSTLLTGTCAAIAALVGPFLLTMIYGRAYAGAGRPLEIMLLEVTLSGAVFIMSQGYMALGRPGMVTLFQATGLSISLPLMLLLIPRWGISGAAFALLISTLARFLFVYFGFGIFLRVRRPYLLPRFSDLDAILRRLKAKPPADGTVASVP